MVSKTADRPLSLSYRRPADRLERIALERTRDGLVHDPKADLNEVGAALLMGFISLLFIGPIAILLTWIIEALTTWGLGSFNAWQTGALLWLTAWACMGALRVAIRRARTTAAVRALDVDVASGEVTEESWRFVEAAAFQEAETLPLLYLARADDGRVVVFDERQLLGRERVASEPILAMAPADAVLVRGTVSGLLLSESYSGPSLPIGEIRPLVVAMDSRPVHGAVLDRPFPGAVMWLSGKK